LDEHLIDVKIKHGGNLMKELFVLGLCVLLVMGLAGCVSQEEAAKELSVPGTGACEGILNEVATAFNSANPGYVVVIPESTGSSGGIRSVGEDEAVLGRVAKAIKDEEYGYGLTYTEFARDMVVFAVSGDVDVTGLTKAQLLGIFSGEVENWNEVGGSDGVINVFIREPGDSSLEVIQKSIPSFKDIEYASHAKMLYHDYEMVEMLEKYKNSIGFITSSSLLGTSIKALALDGVVPTKENVLSGEYKLSGNYAFVYKEGNLNEIAEKFMDFVFSDAGTQVIEGNGLIAVGK
jgi:phosphate transport system substrate-binding protein